MTCHKDAETIQHNFQHRRKKNSTLWMELIRMKKVECLPADARLEKCVRWSLKYVLFFFVDFIGWNKNPNNIDKTDV